MSLPEAAYRWISNVHYETWDSLPQSSYLIAIGDGAGARIRNASFCICVGPGVGSAILDERGLIIIALPNNRLFKADLINETAEFVEYSDDAAMVAPEYR